MQPISVYAGETQDIGHMTCYVNVSCMLLLLKIDGEYTGCTFHRINKPCILSQSSQLTRLVL